MIFKNEYTINLESLGTGNKATNKAIISIMEDVGSLHSASVGYGVNDIEKTKVAWVILDWKVRIIKRPSYNEKVIAHTWACGMNRAFAYRNFELKDKEGNTFAIGSTRWVLLNIETRRPERLKPDLGELFGAEADRHIFPEGDPDFRDIPNINELLENGENDAQYNYQVERRDIDINGHVHNINYLEIAYEVLPEEIYQNQEISNIRIHYKKEIMYGQKVKCEYRMLDHKNYVVMTSDDQTNAIIILD